MYTFTYDILQKSLAIAFFIISASIVSIVVGVLVGIGVILAIIAVAIYLVKRKNRRVVATQAVTTNTTTTVTTNQPPPARYAQPNSQQYPSTQGPPPFLPAGMQPGPPPPGSLSPYPQAGQYNPVPGMVLNPGYGAYAQPPHPQGATPLTQAAPPPYFQTEGMKPGSTSVEL